MQLAIALSPLLSSSYPFLLLVSQSVGSAYVCHTAPPMFLLFLLSSSSSQLTVNAGLSLQTTRGRWSPGLLFKFNPLPSPFRGLILYLVPRAASKILTSDDAWKLKDC